MAEAMTDGSGVDNIDFDAGLDVDVDADAEESLRELLEGAFGPGAMNLLGEEEPIPETEDGPAVGGSLDDLIARIDREVGAPAPFRASTGMMSRRLNADTSSRFIAFHLAESHYAVPMANVLEVQRPPRVTPIPHVPSWVLGVTNLRGEVLSVVDLRAFFGLEPLEYEKSGRMIVVRSTGQEVATGLIVDSVVGGVNLPPDRFDPTTATLEGRVEPYLSGVAEDHGRMLVVLDLDRLLLSAEMRQFQPL